MSEPSVLPHLSAPSDSSFGDHAVIGGGLRSHVTLGLCTILHAFTHAYGTILVPLYLLMVRDLKLPGVSRASFIVTIYGLVYCLGSYIAGVMADRFNRKVLLGIGLLGNALAITAMGLTRQYELIVACGVLAGVFGTLFHPAANALVPAHYPKSPGMAIGLLGMGSGIGFFAGPQFAGWRAQSATWNFASVADWQRPLVEAGLAGFVFGVVFLFVAREVRHSRSTGTSHQLGGVLARKVARLASVLMCRDFAGLAVLSLASIYLQKAHHLDAKHTGIILGSTMLLSVIVSPLAVYLSAGRRRLPTLVVVLIGGGVMIAITPLFPVRYVLPILMTFMTFQLGSYSVSDAAMLERVPADVRGRVVGIFLLIAGTFSSTAPFVMGWCTDRLGQRAGVASEYFPIFLGLGVMMLLAIGAIPLIHALGVVTGPPIDPITETTPRTVEPGL